MARLDEASGDRRRSHAEFLESGRPSSRVRTVVAESWIRSSAAGVNPDGHLAPVVLESADLVDYRSAHPRCRHPPGRPRRRPARTVPVWMSVSQYEYWKHTHLTVDVVKGRGSGFSVEAPEGVRFMIRSRLMSDAESAAFGLV